MVLNKGRAGYWQSAVSDQGEQQCNSLSHATVHETSSWLLGLSTDTEEQVPWSNGLYHQLMKEGASRKHKQVEFKRCAHWRDSVTLPLNCLLGALRDSYIQRGFCQVWVIGTRRHRKSVQSYGFHTKTWGWQFSCRCGWLCSHLSTPVTIWPSTLSAFKMPWTKPQWKSEWFFAHCCIKYSITPWIHHLLYFTNVSTSTNSTWGNLDDIDLIDESR